MSDDPRRGLLELAEQCGRDAVFWRRRFNRIGLVAVVCAPVWLGIGAVSVLSPKPFVFGCGLLLIAVGIFDVWHARRCFRQAGICFDDYMQIRQSCLDAITISEQ